MLVGCTRIIFTTFLLLLFDCVYSQSDTLKEHLVVERKVIEGINTFSSVEIDSASLSKYFGQTSEELLGKSSGLYVKQYGPGNLATISIRGSSASQTQLFWNGIPVNSPTLGSSDLALLPIDFFNSLTIRKGGSSLSSGSGGIGGAICLSTEPNFDEQLHLSAEQVLGSFGIKRTILKLNHSSKNLSISSGYIQRSALNNFQYLDISNSEQPSISRENASTNQHFFMQEAALKINQNSQLEAKLNYVDSWRQIPPVLGATNNGEFQRDKQLKSVLIFSNNGKSFLHNIKLGYIREKMSYNDTANEIFSNFLTNSFHSTYRMTKVLSRIKAKLQGFISSRIDRASSDYYVNLITQNVSSAFVKWEHEINRFEYHFSLRQEMLGPELLPFTPSFGIEQTFLKDDRWNTAFNISITNRIPSLNDRFWVPGGNTDLLPENGFEVEHNNRVYFSEKFIVSAALFYGQTLNWILWTPNSSGDWSAENVKEVQRYGLETKMETYFSLGNGKIDLSAQYNYLNVSALSSNVANDASIGKQLIYVPFHQGQFDVSFVCKNVTVFYSQAYVGKVFIDRTNSSYLPHYYPADCGINWSSKYISGKQLVVGIKINNIYNEQYHVMANRPMPGAHFLLNLKINLKK